MAWARLDDRYHDNPKVKLAWRAEPASIGLHCMAITYCAMHETNGEVDPLWLEEKLPRPTSRRKVINALVGAGLFDPLDNGRFYVHDYLDFNQSREQAEAQRAALAAKRSAAGRKGAHARWGMANANGKPMANDMANADHVANGSNSPRPDPTQEVDERG